jgi:ADP-ribose pyrophosphatase
VSARKPPAGGDLTETTVSTRLVYDGGMLRVRRDEVRLPDGAQTWREYVEHPGAVMVLAFLDPGTILLERQYRYPRRSHYIELPAGKIEPGEPPVETAKRELIEECGYEAEHWTSGRVLHTCNGYSDELIELFVARDLRHVGARLDAGEHLETFAASIDDALEWVRDGTITDTKTTYGLLWWDKWGRSQLDRG